MSQSGPFSYSEGGKSKHFPYFFAKNNLSHGIIGLDLNGIIESWNRGASRITGYEEQEVLGKELSAVFFTPEDILLKVPLLELTKAVQDGCADDQRWQVKKGGERFWATGAVSQVRDDSGRLVGLCKIFQDNTLRKKTEEKLLNANRELSQIASIAAHDLRQPLRTIRQYVQLLNLLAQNELSSKSKGLLRTVLENTLRMDALIHDILCMAEIGKHRETVERVSCNRVFNLVVAALSKEIEEQGAVVVRGNLPAVTGVASQLGRLLQNLIDNGIKFHSPGRLPRVEVQAFAKEEEWHFCVTDNGIGIEREEMENIFEDFKRLHAQSEFEGSGLGLSICKKIVEHHRGKIWVESDGAMGSKFFFTLPKS